MKLSPLSHSRIFQFPKVLIPFSLLFCRLPDIQFPFSLSFYLFSCIHSYFTFLFSQHYNSEIHDNLSIRSSYTYLMKLVLILEPTPISKRIFATKAGPRLTQANVSEARKKALSVSASLQSGPQEDSFLSFLLFYDMMSASTFFAPDLIPWTTSQQCCCRNIKSYFCIFANFVNAGSHASSTVPIEPFLCLAIMTSATFFLSVS